MMHMAFRPKSRAQARPSKPQRQTDIIIPVMGPTGVGKSTFINIAANQTATRVGHTLNSCTAEIQVVAVPYPFDNSRRVVFVDTPGFDDTYVSDTEILKRIADWLKSAYNSKKKLSGIIYLHDISQTRMLGSLRHNFQMFNKLCGDDAAKNIVLATTKWNQVLPEVGEQRERQLAEAFWRDLLRMGSRNLRFLGNHDSAWQIVNSIIAENAIEEVLIQQELVNLLKILPETEAGNTLRYTLKELLETYKKAARQLRQDGKEVTGDEEKQRLAEVEERLRGTIDQIREMQIPIGRRIMRFLGLV